MEKSEGWGVSNRVCNTGNDFEGVRLFHERYFCGFQITLHAESGGCSNRRMSSRK